MPKKTEMPDFLIRPKLVFIIGRNGAIWTRDPSVPNAIAYIYLSEIKMNKTVTTGTTIVVPIVKFVAIRTQFFLTIW